MKTKLKFLRNYDSCLKQFEINYLGRNYSSKIYLLDNTIIYPYHLNVSRDSLTFSNSDDENFHKIPIGQIAKITFKDNRASLFSGLWIGIVSGALATLISVVIMDCKTCHPNIGPLIIGAIAVPIGFITGYIFSGEREYIFNETGQY
jgi:hypothetical protein